MKLKLIISLFIPIVFLFSCVKDELPPQVLKTSENNLHFSGNGGAWLLTINTNADWKISGVNDWCTVDKTDGKNTAQIIISVSPNPEKESRSVTLQVNSDRSHAALTVQQDTIIGEDHYRLPVVFHIIYSEASDTAQNIKTETLYQLIENCNQLYRNNINSIDMNVELFAATQDTSGNDLQVPGVHYVLRSNSAYQSCEKFMDEKTTKDADLLWNPNKYVNVYVYTFSEKNTLGISHIPFTTSPNGLEGLKNNNYYYTHFPKFPYGISLNNTYIYEEDAYKTLAHELGHYLGLLHVFSEKDCSDEEDQDYCDDTPNYNRQEYSDWLSANLELTTQEKYQRTSCEGISFTSYNIMDYDYSYMNQFTADQFKRVRHVLANSPLIPGPKNIIVTKGLVEDEKPEVRVSR